MAVMNRLKLSLAFLILLLAMQRGSAEVKEMGSLAFQMPSKAHYAFGGVVGDRVQANLENWLLRAPIANPGMIEMFRVRDREPVPQLVPWAGEFVGKYLISAIQARRMVEDPRLEAMIRDVISDLISTQAEDGYLGPFRKSERLLGNWDLWGHYHVITALLLWNEDTGDEASLQAAIRAGDLVCNTFLDTGHRPLEAGSDEMNLSILTAMGRLYRHTGNERYLRMMKMVEEDWEKAGDYFRQGLAGVEYYKIPKPRWESLHDVQGLVELYRITGNEDYKTAFVNLWRSIQRLDRHNTGGFSTGEQAIGNPFTPGAIETCCTTAWAALSADMLMLTGDSTAADELEWSLFNSILGSQHPSGRWWTYNTPMDGKREASAHTIVFQARAGTPELNCCSVNAPRGLGVISEWGILTDKDNSLIINYYGPMQARVTLPSGIDMKIQEETQYPTDGHVTIHVSPSKPIGYPVRIRIPAWSKHTVVKVNGEQVMPDLEVTPGRYLSFARQWKDGDKINLDLDMSIRTWVGDAPMLGKVSLFRGPFLLAFDQRDNDYDCNQIPPLDFTKLDYEPADSKEKFPPSVLCRFKSQEGKPVVLRDFASAGAAGTEYVSWLPVVNAPPPAFHLLSPSDRESIPLGPNKLTWTGTRGDPGIQYVVEISEDQWISHPLITSEPQSRCWYVLREKLEPGKAYYWRVTSRNGAGLQTNEEGVRSFAVDAALPNKFIDHPALLGFREDGLVSSSPLDGDGTPAFGYLEEGGKVQPSTDRHGKEGGAVHFSGDGMLRYRIPSFPSPDYTFMAWICPDEFPEGRIAQIFSAWARGSDDPLRVVIDGGHLFARIEGGSGAGTQGVELTIGKWVHVAAVKKGPRLALYLNGKLIDETNAPGDILSTSAEDFAIGGNPHYGGNEFYVGCIDDFSFYAKALSEEEIAASAAK
jgi:hypothetical protein